MKILFALILAALISPAFADDAANNAENTVDSSKNPITGTVTTTRKHKRKLKNGKNQAKVEVTEKTKVHKNGEVDKTVDVKGDSTDHGSDGEAHK
jgi:hypothetical protein